MKGFRHHEMDIRNRKPLIQLIAEILPDAIVHTAAQPSHDRAAAIPLHAMLGITCYSHWYWQT